MNEVLSACLGSSVTNGLQLDAGNGMAVNALEVWVDLGWVGEKFKNLSLISFQDMGAVPFAE